MNPMQLFLREHAGIHSKHVAPAEFNVDWIVDGLDEAALRAMPHGLNSIVWLLWHIARVEDGCLGHVALGVEQTLSDPAAGWAQRLVGAPGHDGSSMSKAEVAEFSASVPVAEVLEYRHAVGRRTRELLPELWPDRWAEPLTRADAERAVASGIMPPDAREFIPGKPREALLWWWGVQHSIYHLGQAAQVRARLLAS